MRINQSIVAMESERQASRGYMQEVTVGPKERVPNAWVRNQGNLTGRQDTAGREEAATLELSEKGEARPGLFF